MIINGEDVSQYTITCSEAQVNIHALNDHNIKYYVSIYDENQQVIEVPVMKNGLQAMKEIPCDSDGNVLINFTLEPGFYYVKVFTKDNFQYCILNQDITHAVIQ